MNEAKKKAIKLIILFGLISLLGDLVYEGARSVNGPYLKLLGANAAVVGLIVGLGEFLGYGIRLASGYFSDKTKAYWFFTIIGYGLIISVPLLSFADVWQYAALFIVLERIGKAIRSPAKDTIMSHATKQVGTGFGFGLHEFFDQIGGILGPMIFTLFFMGVGGSAVLVDYQRAYGLMWVPFILLMVTVIAAYLTVKNPEELEVTEKKDVSETPKKVFWLYVAFTFISTLGFVNFALVGYHLKTKNLMNDAEIPLLYAGAMAIDGLVAILIGRYYDKLKKNKKSRYGGLLTLSLIPVISAVLPLLAFSYDRALIIFGAFAWGVVMATHETIMRAAIADITEIKKRGISYGIFNTAYGLAMFFGGGIIGALYDMSLNLMFLAVIAIEIIAIFTFTLMWKEQKKTYE